MADSPNYPNCVRDSAIPFPPQHHRRRRCGDRCDRRRRACRASAVARSRRAYLCRIGNAQRINARVKTVGKAHDDAEELFHELEPRTDFISLSDGLSVAPDQLDHDGIDKHFADPGLPEQNIRAAVKKLLSYRTKPLTPELQAEREAKGKPPMRSSIDICSPRRRPRSAPASAKRKRTGVTSWTSSSTPKGPSWKQSRGQKPARSPCCGSRRTGKTISTVTTWPQPSAAPSRS